MYRILVVDDEPMIVEGLCSLLEENNRWDLEIHKACLGQDALAILNRVRVDVLLSDIRMPVVSGIDLMKQVRTHWPHCRVIFLTAFEEFEYAYIAVKSSGVRFLLKTEGHDEILSAVASCVAEIEAEVRAETLRIRSTQQQSLLRTLQARDFLQEALQGVAGHVTQEKLDGLGLSLRADAELYLLLGAFPAWERAPYGQAGTLCALLLGQTGGKLSCTVCSADGAAAVWVVEQSLNPSGSAPDASVLLVDSLESVQNSMDNAPSFVLSSRPCGWGALAREYKRLYALLNMRLATGTSFVYAAPDTMEDAPDGGPIPLADTCRKEIEFLTAYVDTGNRTAFSKKLGEIYDALLTVCDRQPALGQELAIQLNLFFLTNVNRLGNGCGRDADLEVLDMLRTAELRAPLQRERYAQLGQILFSVREASGHSLLLDAVENVKGYIARHLDGDLSLSRLASVANFNPKYLSQLFGEQTGVNLSDYIAQRRLNRAKQLIADGAMKMQEISAAVGFFSPSYFTRFFKRATDMTPQQYRDYLTSKELDKG